MSEETKNVAVVLGFLTREQAAEQIPFDKSQDAAMLLQRLIARGSLPTVDIGNTQRIALEKLRAFLADGGRDSTVRKALGLPSETLAPMCAIAGSRFARHPLAWQAEQWQTALSDEVFKQLPERVAEVGSPEVDGTKVWGVKAGASVTVQATVTPEIAALIAQGLPENSPLSPLADYSMFRNMSELHSALRLQGFALDVAANLARANMGKYTRVETPGYAVDGVAGLYQSPADYVAIVNAALGEMATMPVVSRQKLYPALPGDGHMQTIQVTVQLSGEQLLTAAGIDGTRLACLAF